MSVPRADDAELADAAAHWKGAYVHIPFCARRCPYCDFAVVVDDDGFAARYVDAVVAETAMEPDWDALDAVHFGGGTPSRLPAHALRRMLDALRSRFGLAADAEVSLEANPEDCTEGYAAEVREAGFTRVSLGVQSFDETVLGSLGRAHDPATADAAVAAARAAGFATVNVDLIFGTPGESLASWRDTVDRAAASGPQHVSTYALTVERGTELQRQVTAGAPGPDADDQASKWEHAAAQLEAAGLVRYETSNFAASGHACRYNLLTWAQGEYLAFGMAAHGHRAAVRRRNLRRMHRYLAVIEQGERPEVGREEESDWGREQERLLLGLRRAAGVAAGDGGRRLLASEWGSRLAASGVIAISGGRLRVVRPLLGDEVARAVLALHPVEC